MADIEGGSSRYPTRAGHEPWVTELWIQCSTTKTSQAAGREDTNFTR